MPDWSGSNWGRKDTPEEKRGFWIFLVWLVLLVAGIATVIDYLT